MPRPRSDTVRHYIVVEYHDVVVGYNIAESKWIINAQLICRRLGTPPETPLRQISVELTDECYRRMRRRLCVGWELIISDEFPPA